MPKNSEDSENILNKISDLFGVLKFDQEKIEKFAKDTSSIAVALLIVMIASILSVLGVSFVPIEILDKAVEFNLRTIIHFAFINFVFEIISLFVTVFLVKFLFKAKGDSLSFVKVAGSANVIKFLNIIPFLSLFTSVWCFILQIKILQKLYKIGRLAVISSMILSTLLVTLVALLVVS